MKKILFFIIAILLSLNFGQAVLAATSNESGSTFSPTSVKLENPLGSNIIKVDGKEIDTRKDFRYLIGDIIGGVLGVLGALSLGVFVAGGFMWLTSAGNAEQVKKGTQTMLWAIVGLFVIFSSYAILNMLLEGVTAGYKMENPPASSPPTTQEKDDTNTKAGTCWYQQDGDASKCEQLTETECFSKDLALFYPEGRSCSDLQTLGSCLFPTKQDRSCVEEERAYCEGIASQYDPPVNVNDPNQYVWRPGETCP